MKRKALFALILCAFLAGLACVLWLLRRDELAYRAGCRSRIRAAAFTISNDVMDQDGVFPQSMSSMRGFSQESITLFVKHQHGDQWDPPPGTSIDDWMDYFYVYWPEGIKTPGHYPILYDRRLSYHKGKGINVCHVNVVVSFADYPVASGPWITWDENAEWLTKFARDHPELDIPLPEDLGDN